MGCLAPATLSVKSLQDRASIERWADRFWEVQDPPEFTGKARPRVAIAEFALEYVANTSAESGQKVDLSQGLASALPEVLYHAFVETIPEFNREAISLEVVSTSDAYQKLRGTGLADLNLDVDSVTGVLYPANGLMVLDVDQPNTGLLALIAEVEADVVIQVRLRIGLHKGHGVIDKGSTFRVLTRNGVGLLESRIALVSEGLVIDPGETEIDASTLHIDSSRFAEQVRTLFRPYISMALMAAD